MQKRAGCLSGKRWRASLKEVVASEVLLGQRFAWRTQAVSAAARVFLHVTEVVVTAQPLKDQIQECNRGVKAR